MPGDSDSSLLIEAISYSGLYEMPPTSKLPSDEIAVLMDWVNRGVPWPQTDAAVDIPADEFLLDERKAAHWAWQPLTDPAIPTVEEPGWCHDDLDRFILAKLDAAQLGPAPSAKPEALLRRAYFDLVGLPPPADVVRDFTAAPSRERFVEIVDELLASKHFGERWGRHWLDLMRYAETRGHEFDYLIPNAWQYRDYVIRALNEDVPYDQFVLEHIAGDLLSEPRRHPTAGYNESVLATAFWYLNDWVHSPVDIRKDEADRFDNAIDVYSKAFLAMTVACARCHDHKFDAISQEDYYALVGFLQSSDYRQVRFESREHNLAIARQLSALIDETSSELATELLGATEALHDSVPTLLTTALHNLQQPKSALQNDAQRWTEALRGAADDETHPLHPLATWSPDLDPAPPSRTVEDHEFLTVVDFDTRNPVWLPEGPAFGGKPLSRGTLIPGTAKTPVLEVVPRGRAQLDPQLAQLQFHDESESPQRNARSKMRPESILRMPMINLSAGKLYYLVRGGALVHAVVDSHRLLDGPLHGSTYLEIANDPSLRWVEHDLSRYRGHGVLVEFAANGDSPLQILKVVESTTPPPAPQTPNIEITQQKAEAAALYAAQLISESLRWLEDPQSTSSELADRNARLVQWLASSPELWAEPDDGALAAILAEYHTAREGLLAQLQPTSMVAPAIFDATAEDQPLFVRGNPATPGKVVSRRMLTAIAGEQTPIPTGSGRLALAKRTISNPLASRVIANRVWHHLMGRGIVPSTDNFGVLGERPSHPELLDHLAQRFIAGEWSIKRFVRAVMLSSTYQMSSDFEPNDAGTQIDPTNTLYHRAHLKRLEGEAIRDAVLSISGRLDQQMFGPSVPVHLTPFMDGRGKPESGPLDGDGRRSIYQAVRRNFLSPMMLAFDTPQPSSPVGRRTASNVPAQALLMMNSPFVRGQAELWARELLAMPHPTDNDKAFEKRLAQMYQAAFARTPTQSERVAAQSYIEKRISDDGVTDVEAWTDLCHVMFNTKEFIFLR